MVVIALCGLASAASPLRAFQHRSDIAVGRLSKPSALQNEINDLILPLLSPRRKTADGKSQLQLSDLFTDPLKRRNKPFVKLAPIGKLGEGKNRDKSSVAIFFADLPKTSTVQRDENDRTHSTDDDDDNNVSHHTEDEEQEDYSTEETPEVHDKPENYEALESNNNVESAVVDSEVDEFTNKLERSDNENALDEIIQQEAKDSLDESTDLTLDESLSTSKPPSQDIASASKAEQVTESAELPQRDTVLECVQRKVTASESRSAEEQVLGELPSSERTIPDGYWRHYRTESTKGDIDSGWMHDHSYVGPQKSYHLSFSFTK